MREPRIVWSEPPHPQLVERLSRGGVVPVRHHYIRVGDDVYGVMEFSDGSTQSSTQCDSWELNGYERSIALARIEGRKMLQR